MEVKIAGVWGECVLWINWEGCGVSMLYGLNCRIVYIEGCGVNVWIR